MYHICYYYPYIFLLKLLKIRDSFKNAYNSGNQNSIKTEISKLREIYESDIIGTIETSYKNGVISRADMNTLIALTHKLFEHLYSQYSNYEEVDNMLHDESLELEIDKYIDAVDDLTEKLAESNRILAEKDDLLSQKDNQLAESEKQIALLKKQLEEYQSIN